MSVLKFTPHKRNSNNIFIEDFSVFMFRKTEISAFPYFDEKCQVGSFIGKYSVVELMPYLVELMRSAVAIISRTSSRR